MKRGDIDVFAQPDELVFSSEEDEDEFVDEFPVAIVPSTLSDVDGERRGPLVGALGDDSDSRGLTKASDTISQHEAEDVSYHPPLIGRLIAKHPFVVIFFSFSVAFSLSFWVFWSYGFELDNRTEYFTARGNVETDLYQAFSRAVDGTVFDEHALSIKTRTIAQRSERAYFLSIVYAATSDSHTLFRLDSLERIVKLEQDLVNHPDYTRFCVLDYSKGNASGCVPHSSIASVFVDPLTKQVNENVSAVIDSVLSLPLSTQRTFFGKDLTPAGRKTAYMRSFFSFGGPLPGFRSTEDRTAEQGELFRVFVVKYREIFQRFRDDRHETGVDVFYIGSELTQADIDDIVNFDASLAGASAGFILLYTLFQTGSVFVAICGMMDILFAFPLAYWAYRVVIGIKMFNTLNGLGLFIIAGIGADDVFVANDHYKASRHMHSSISGSSVNRVAWAHGTSARAMFVTSFTTGAAFLACTFSSISVICFFGIFCALLVFFNYIFCVTWFFACLVVNENYVSRLWRLAFPSGAARRGRRAAIFSLRALFCVWWGRPPRSRGEPSRVESPGIVVPALDMQAIRKRERDVSGASSLISSARSTKPLLTRPVGQFGPPDRDISPCVSVTFSDSLAGGSSDSDAASEGLSSGIEGAVQAGEEQSEGLSSGAVEDVVEAYDTADVDVTNSGPAGEVVLDLGINRSRATEASAGLPVQRRFTHPDGDLTVDGHVDVKALRLTERVMYQFYAPGIYRVRWILLVVGIVVVGVSLYFALQLPPEDRDLQLLKDSNPVSKAFTLSRYEFYSSSADKITVHFVWGLKGIDRSGTNYWRDPEDFGRPVWRHFDLAREDSQLFMLNFCAALRNNSNVLQSKTAVTCFMEDFKAYIESATVDVFPVPSHRFHSHLWNFTAFMRSVRHVGQPDTYSKVGQSYDSTVGFDPTTAELRYVQVFSELNKAGHVAPGPARKIYADFGLFLEGVVTENPACPIGLRDVVQVSLLYVAMVTSEDCIRAGVVGVFLGLAIVFVVVFLLTRNILTTSIALFSVATIVSAVIASVHALGWRLGLLESIALIIVSGISCDFVVHLVFAFHSSHNHSRFRKMRDSATEMGGSVFSAGITTLGASVFLWFAVVTVFQKFGTFLALNIGIAVLVAFGPTLALLTIFGPINRQFELPGPRRTLELMGQMLSSPFRK